MATDRLFEGRGWRPVPVRLSEWRSLDTLDEQQDHLRSLLQ